MLKKTLAGLCAVLFVAAGSVALAGSDEEQSDQITVQGWITDEWCGKKNASAEGKKCAIECAKKGAKLVLFSPSDEKTYGLDDQEQAKSQVGHEVRVMGMLDKDSQTLKVSKIESVSESEKS
ncbi:MAG: hypothetical protein V3U98_10155 [Acidobacteriota bacterium]